LDPESSDGIVCAKDPGAVRIVANTKDTMQLIAFTDHASVIDTLSEHSLKSVTHPDNASSSGAEDAVARVALAIDPSP
jgi:hypothetical protein